MVGGAGRGCDIQEEVGKGKKRNNFPFLFNFLFFFSSDSHNDKVVSALCIITRSREGLFWEEERTAHRSSSALVVPLIARTNIYADFFAGLTPSLARLWHDNCSEKLKNNLGYINMVI